MNTDAKTELIKLEKTIKVTKPKKPDTDLGGSSSKLVTLEQGFGEPAKMKSESKLIFKPDAIVSYQIHSNFQVSCKNRMLKSTFLFNLTFSEAGAED